MNSRFQEPAGKNSTDKIFKFGFLRDDYEEPYAYPDIWATQKTSGPERLIIGPSSQHISLMLEFSNRMTEPLAILYVLVVPRADGIAGRYQCSTPKSRQEVQTFLTRFADFFEGDGRHHVWVAPVPTGDLLAYDRHNVIYAYGHLTNYSDMLSSRGLRKSESVDFPVPHVHKYNAFYDSEQTAVMDYWDWKRTELRREDDY